MYKRGWKVNPSNIPAIVARIKGEAFGYKGEGLINWEDTVVIGNIYENQEIFEGLYNTEITNQNNMTMEDC